VHNFVVACHGEVALGINIQVKYAAASPLNVFASSGINLDFGIGIRSHIQVKIHPEVIDGQLLQLPIQCLGLRGVTHIDNINELLLKLAIGGSQWDKNPGVGLGSRTGIQLQVVGCSKDVQIPTGIGCPIKQLVVVQGGI